MEDKNFRFLSFASAGKEPVCLTAALTHGHYFSGRDLWQNKIKFAHFFVGKW